MRREQPEPERLSVMALCQQVSRGHDIAEALRHLLSAHVDEAVVDPEASQRHAPMGTAALCDLILVVREDEIETAAVNVDRLAQVRPDHRGAFDMPARAAPSPRRFPADDALPARLPEHEIGRIALVGRDLNAGAGDHRLPIPLAEHTIIGVARDGKQHMPLRLIGMAEVDQPLDHGDHRRDLAGRVRRNCGLLDSKGPHVLQIVALVSLGDHRGFNALGLGRGNDLVIDVGDVAGIDEAVGPELVADEPRERVEDHCRAGVADMGAAVDGRPAHIHGDPLPVERNEEPLFASKRVVKADHWDFPAGLGLSLRACTQSIMPRPLALSSG